MKITKTLFLTVVLCYFSSVKAQTIDDIAKIALSVVMPQNVGELNTSQLSRLESKIVQITTETGLSTSGFYGDFVIYPKFAVYETNVADGGMRSIVVAKTELSLFIKQVSTGLVFASVNKSLNGSGANKEAAITNAITQISPSDNTFVSFIETGKQKIIQYYEANCNDIIKKADALIQLQEYEQALGLLMSVPEQILSCRDKVFSKSIEAYKGYQNQTCSELLQRAKTKSMAMDYDGALQILAQIDPSSTCHKEQQTLIKSIESKISADVKQQWEFQMRQYNDAVSLEKLRINAIKEIAVSFFKNQPKTVNYNNIVK